MKVLVTGGAGFIGRHLVDRLISLEYEVDVLDNFSRSSRLEKNEKASYIELDIRDDLDDFEPPLEFSFVDLGKSKSNPSAAS